MPEVGLCADATCDNETKPLYECHCCTRFICLPHLIDHDKKSTQNKRRLEICTDQLTSECSTLEAIIEERTREIEQTKTLLKKAKMLLEIPTCVDDIERVLDQVKDTTAANQKKETVVKVEPSLVDNYSVIAAACSTQNLLVTSTLLHNELAFENDESERQENSRKELQSFELSSPNYSICISTDLTTNGFALSTPIPTVNRASMDMNDYPTKTFVFDDTVVNIANEINGKVEQIKSVSITKIRGQCPLTFDGAFGLTKAKHSLRLCNAEKGREPVLYNHVRHVHFLKAHFARRLIKAIIQGQDSTTTQVFNDDEDIINQYHHHRQVTCPFYGCASNPFGCQPKQIPNTPCRRPSIIFKRLVTHLIKIHHITISAAQLIVDSYQKDQTGILFSENDTIVDMNH